MDPYKEQRVRRLKSASLTPSVVQVHVRIKRLPKELFVVPISDTDSVSDVVEKVLVNHLGMSTEAVPDYTLRHSDGLGNVDEQAPAFGKQLPLRSQLCFPFMTTLCVDPEKVLQARKERWERKQQEKREAQDALNERRDRMISAKECMAEAKAEADLLRCREYEAGRAAREQARAEKKERKVAERVLVREEWARRKEEAAVRSEDEKKREFGELLTRMEAGIRDLFACIDSEVCTRHSVLKEEHNAFMTCQSLFAQAAADISTKHRKRSYLTRALRDIDNKLDAEEARRTRQQELLEDQKDKALAARKAFNEKHGHLFTRSSRQLVY